MSKRHKWADVIIAMANGEDVEFYSPEDEKWYCARLNKLSPFEDPECNWRIKPKSFITVGGINIPAPLASSANIHAQEEFYLCDPVASEYYVAVPWGRVKTHHIYRRLLHTKVGNAIAHTKALILVSGGRVE